MDKDILITIVTLSVITLILFSFAVIAHFQKRKEPVTTDHSSPKDIKKFKYLGKNNDLYSFSIKYKDGTSEIIKCEKNSPQYEKLTIFNKYYAKKMNVDFLALDIFDD